MCDLVQRIKSVRADLANDQVNGFERLSIIDDPERSLRDQVMTGILIYTRRSFHTCWPFTTFPILYQIPTLRQSVVNLQFPDEDL